MSLSPWLSCRPVHRRTPSSGFTLVELLVVISIIALLISILLPSLSKARAMSRSVKCAAITSEFANANQMYANEEDSQYVALRDATNRPSGGWQFTEWPGNPKFKKNLGMRKGFGSNWQLQLQMWTEELFCPDIPENLPFNELYRPHTNYGFNEEGLTVQDGVKPGAHLPSVVLPAEKVQLVDANVVDLTRGYGNYNSRWLVNKSEDLSIREVAYRHQGGANVLHMDGHSSYYSMEELYRPGDTRQMNRMWPIYE